MVHSIKIAGCCAIMILNIVASTYAAETRLAQTDMCTQFRTKAECQNQPACKIFRATDGKDYCVRNTRDYPPYKGGYPLSE